MRMTRGWTGLRPAVVFLGLCALMTRGVGASTLDSTSTTDSTSLSTPVTAEMQYRTSGAVGTTGITGPNIISFVPETSGAFMAPSSFSLGTFVVGNQPAGMTTTYNNTPFSITFDTLKVNGAQPTVNESPITITGVLNGSINGPSQSDVVATFNPISQPSFRTGSYLSTLNVVDQSLSLVPSTTNFGRTTAQAQLVVSASPIPEPTTITLFVTTLIGLGMRRRFRHQAA